MAKRKHRQDAVASEKDKTKSQDVKKKKKNEAAPKSPSIKGRVTLNQEFKTSSKFSQERVQLNHCMHNTRCVYK